MFGIHTFDLTKKIIIVMKHAKLFTFCALFSLIFISSCRKDQENFNPIGKDYVNNNLKSLEGTDSLKFAGIIHNKILSAYYRKYPFNDTISFNTKFDFVSKFLCDSLKYCGLQEYTDSFDFRNKLDSINKFTTISEAINYFKVLYNNGSLDSTCFHYSVELLNLSAEHLSAHEDIEQVNMIIDSVRSNKGIPLIERNNIISVLFVANYSISFWNGFQNNPPDPELLSWFAKDVMGAEMCLHIGGPAMAIGELLCPGGGCFVVMGAWAAIQSCT